MDDRNNKFFAVGLAIALSVGAIAALAQSEMTTPGDAPGGSGAGFTPGSVLFAGTNKKISQDNAQFFWFDTNRVLQMGLAYVGTWPANTSYAFFGNTALNQAAIGNYALLQGTPGDTYVNAAAGQVVSIRINNLDTARFGAGFMVGTLTDPGAGISNVLTGYRIGNAATSGHVLRGNGTNFVDAAIGSADLPSPFTSGTRSGNTASFATTSGSLTNGDCAKFDANGNIVDAGAACGSGGGSSTVVAPQGRLTLQSATPVMTADQTAKSTIYYDCYAGNLVYYYSGSADTSDTIAACEVSLTMVAGAATAGGDNSTSGGINNNGVFDIWWVHGGANRICIANGAAASHSGGGWASDTGGSSTARGTGYSQLDFTSRPYITNKNAITNCWNGSTNYGSVSANQGSYLGTIYTTAAGQTGVALRPTGAAGGTANVIGLSNGYNRVPVQAINRDTTSSWSYASTTWRRANNNSSNVIKFVDGLQTSPVEASYYQSVFPTSSAGVEYGPQLDWSSGAPDLGATTYAGVGSLLTANAPAPGWWYPVLGLHQVDAVEAAYNTTSSTIYGSGWGSTSGQMQGLLVKIRM